MRQPCLHITLTVTLLLCFPGRVFDSTATPLDYAAVTRQVEMLAGMVRDYMKAVAPDSKLDPEYLARTCYHRGVDICFVLAQGHLESHFGTTGMARKTNSAWNVGAGDHGEYDKIHGIHKYSHPNESLVPYLDMLEDIYLSDGRTTDDLLKRYTTPGGKRYASHGHYERKLSSIYWKIRNNTHIYEQQYFK